MITLTGVLKRGTVGLMPRFLFFSFLGISLIPAQLIDGPNEAFLYGGDDDHRNNDNDNDEMTN